jgi:hypothetical protein
MHTSRRFGTSLGFINILALSLVISATMSCTSKPPEFVTMTARVIVAAIDAKGGRE